MLNSTDQNIVKIYNQIERLELLLSETIPLCTKQFQLGKLNFASESDFSDNSHCILGWHKTIDPHCPDFKECAEREYFGLYKYEFNQIFGPDEYLNLDDRSYTIEKALARKISALDRLLTPCRH